MFFLCLYIWTKLCTKALYTKADLQIIILKKKNNYKFVFKKERTTSNYFVVQKLKDINII